MRPQLLLVFILFSWHSTAQKPTTFPVERIPPEWNPEKLWQLRDSLETIDTLHHRDQLQTYYAKQYLCDSRLYLFDKQPQHLVNGLAWTAAQIFHDSPKEKLLVQGLYCSTQLNDSATARHYLKLLTALFPQDIQSSQTKRQVNSASATFHWGEYSWDPALFDGLDGISCDLDTNLSIYHKKKLQPIPDRFNRSAAALVEGDSTYLEFRVHTKNCRCSDCQYTSTILIRIDSDTLPQFMDLDATNTRFTIENVWRVDPLIQITHGKYFRNEHGIYLILSIKNRHDDPLELIEFYWFSPETWRGL